MGQTPEPLDLESEPGTAMVSSTKNDSQVTNGSTPAGPASGDQAPTSTFLRLARLRWRLARSEFGANRLDDRLGARLHFGSPRSEKLKVVPPFPPRHLIAPAPPYLVERTTPQLNSSRCANPVRQQVIEQRPDAVTSVSLNLGSKSQPISFREWWISNRRVVVDPGVSRKRKLSHAQGEVGERHVDLANPVLPPRTPRDPLGDPDVPAGDNQR